MHSIALEKNLPLEHNTIHAFFVDDNFFFFSYYQVLIRDKFQVHQSIIEKVNVVVGPRKPQFYQSNYEGWIFETDHSNNP